MPELAKSYRLNGRVMRFEKTDYSTTNTTSTTSTTSVGGAQAGSGSQSPSTSSTTTSIATSAFSRAEITIEINLDHEQSSPNVPAELKKAVVRITVNQRINSFDGQLVEIDAFRFISDGAFEAKTIRLNDSGVKLETILEYVRETPPAAPNTVPQIAISTVGILAVLIAVVQLSRDFENVFSWFMGGIGAIFGLGAIGSLLSNRSKHSVSLAAWSAFERS